MPSFLSKAVDAVRSIPKYFGYQWKEVVQEYTYNAYGQAENKRDFTASCLSSTATISALFGSVNLDIVYLIVFKANVLPSSWQVNAEHRFIVFTTKSGMCFSIEKQEDGIILQHSSNFNDVVNKFKGTARREPKEKNSFFIDSFKPPSMYVVLDWLSKSNQLTTKYNLIHANCNRFVRELIAVITALSHPPIPK